MRQHIHTGGFNVKTLQQHTTSSRRQLLGDPCLSLQPCQASSWYMQPPAASSQSSGHGRDELVGGGRLLLSAEVGIKVRLARSSARVITDRGRCRGAYAWRRRSTVKRPPLW
jgi:hypothetical protein